jgi:hypothetical protein
MAPAISSLPVPVSPRTRTGGIAFRHLAHHCQHFLERAARADDALEVVDVALRVTEVVDLMLHPPHLERLLDLDLHLLDLEGLLHVVERAGLDGLDGGGHGAERGHEDDGGRGMQLLGGLQHLEARCCHPSSGR